MAQQIKTRHAPNFRRNAVPLWVSAGNGIEKNIDLSQRRQRFVRFLPFALILGLLLVGALVLIVTHSIVLDAKQIESIKAITNDAGFSLKPIILTIFLHVLAIYANHDQKKIYALIDNVNDETLLQLLGNLSWLDSYSYSGLLSDAKNVGAAIERLVDVVTEVEINQRFINFMLELEKNNYDVTQLAATFRYNEYFTNYRDMVTMTQWDTPNCLFFCKNYFVLLRI